MTHHDWVLPTKPFQPIGKQDAASGGRVQVSLPPLLGLLVATALIDWWVTRTLTRLAIFIPKSDAMVQGYQWLSWLGQMGSTLSALLVVLGIVWMVREEWRGVRFSLLGLCLAGMLALNFVFLVQPPGDLLLLAYALRALYLGLLVWRALKLPGKSRLALLAAAAAMLLVLLHQIAPTLYAARHWPGPPAWGQVAFWAGEALVLLAAVALWWAYGRGVSRRAWLLAALPAMLFGGVFLATPALTATVVIWSNGLTLYLPWWLYAAALWLFGVTVLRRLSLQDHAVAAALLLLAAAGYAPQLSHQVAFGWFALWLLHRPFSSTSPYHPAT